MGKHPFLSRGQTPTEILVCPLLDISELPCCLYKENASFSSRAAQIQWRMCPQTVLLLAPEALNLKYTYISSGGGSCVTYLEKHLLQPFYRNTTEGLMPLRTNISSDGKKRNICFIPKCFINTPA